MGRKNRGIFLVILLVLFGLSQWKLVDTAQRLQKVRSERDSLAQQLSACEANTARFSARQAEHLFVLRQSVKYGISEQLSWQVYRTAVEHDLRPDVFYRMVEQESSFRPHVMSHKRAIGLAQIKTSTARMFNPSLTPGDLYEPRTNLKMGAKYLAYLLDRYDNDYRRALAAYNAGPTRHERASVTGEYSGAAYADRILR